VQGLLFSIPRKVNCMLHLGLENWWLQPSSKNLATEIVCDVVGTDNFHHQTQNSPKNIRAEPLQYSKRRRYLSAKNNYQ
jgi:hypothetical protein